MEVLNEEHKKKYGATRSLINCFRNWNRQWEVFDKKAEGDMPQTVDEFIEFLVYNYDIKYKNKGGDE